MTNIEKAYQLIRDVQDKIENNEYNTVELAGINNLSRSDLDELDLYARQFISTGGCSFEGLREPLGNIKKVLDSYGIKSMY